MKIRDGRAAVSVRSDSCRKSERHDPLFARANGKGLDVGRESENLPVVSRTLYCVLATWNARVIALTALQHDLQAIANDNRRFSRENDGFFYWRAPASGAQSRKGAIS